MRGFGFSCLSVALSLSVVGACRASFKDIQKRSLQASRDDLEAGGSGDAKIEDEDYPILEVEKELPATESAAYNCAGIVVIHEKGEDRNLDGILQPTEVTEVITECRLATVDAEDDDDDLDDEDDDDDEYEDCTNQNGDKVPCPTTDDPGQSYPTRVL